MEQRSFTLIELLVVIAVIGLLASIVIVNLTGTRGKANIAKGLQFSQSIHHTLGAYAVGVWSFDEGSGTTANDASGYNNNGTLVNGPVWRCASVDPNYTPSGQGCSLQFDGVDDYVDVGNSSDLIFAAEDEVSISLWFKKPAIQSAYPVLIGRGDWNSSNSYTFTTYVGFLSFNMGVNYYGGARYSLSNIENDTWYHAIGIATANQQRLYVNGALVATRDVDKASVTSLASTYIGKGITATYFKGHIDEVRIYEKALETAQVEALYYAGLDSLLAKGLIDKEEYQERLVLR